MPELPIYPERGEAPGYALERRRKRLVEVADSPDSDTLARLRADCIFQTLRLTGVAVERSIVDRASRSERGADGVGDGLVEGLFSALDAVEEAARGTETPDTALIQSVHRLSNPPADGSFRTHDIRPQFANARRSSPRFIGAKLDNLLGWLSAESGRSMFPAERMALWFSRFIEIAPFDRGNFRTAHLLSSFFANAAGYPPVSFEVHHSDAIREDVERALRFDTLALVTRFSEALSRALAACEEAISSKGDSG